MKHFLYILILAATTACNKPIELITLAPFQGQWQRDSVKEDSVMRYPAVVKHSMVVHRDTLSFIESSFQLQYIKEDKELYTVKGDSIYSTIGSFRFKMIGDSAVILSSQSNTSFWSRP